MPAPSLTRGTPLAVATLTPGGRLCCGLPTTALSPISRTRPGLPAQLLPGRLGRVQPLSRMLHDSSACSRGSQGSGHPSWLARMRGQVDALAERTGTNKSSLLLSFLVLHEVTAGVPWAVLFYAFTYFGAGVYVLQLLIPSDVWISLSNASGPGSRAGMGTGTDGWMSRWADEAVQRARKRGKYGFHAELVDGRIDAAAVAHNDAIPWEEVMAGALADAVAAYLVVKVCMRKPRLSLRVVVFRLHTTEPNDDHLPLAACLTTDTEC